MGCIITHIIRRRLAGPRAQSRPAFIFIEVTCVNHVLSLHQMPAEDIASVLETAVRVKRNPELYQDRLRGRTCSCCFKRRRRAPGCPLNWACRSWAARAVVMDWDKSNFAISPIRYEARYVSRHADIIMARLMRHSDLVQLAESADVPVINGCCERYHPTQALADLLTIRERLGAGRYRHRRLHRNAQQRGQLFDGRRDQDGLQHDPDYSGNQRSRGTMSCWRPRRPPGGSRSRKIPGRRGGPISCTPTRGWTWRTSTIPTTRRKRRGVWR